MGTSDFNYIIGKYFAAFIKPEIKSINVRNIISTPEFIIMTNKSR